jgi:hypothetical protein
VKRSLFTSKTEVDCVFVILFLEGVISTEFWRVLDKINYSTFDLIASLIFVLIWLID